MVQDEQASSSLQTMDKNTSSEAKEVGGNMELQNEQGASDVPVDKAPAGEEVGDDGHREQLEVSDEQRASPLSDTLPESVEDVDDDSTDNESHASSIEESDDAGGEGVSKGVLLDVFKLGGPGWQALRNTNIDVEEVTDHIKLLAESMVMTMYDEPGIGLAAPQIGANVNLICMDPDYNPNDEATRKPVVMLNPVVVGSSKELETVNEACLSVPDLVVPVERPTSVTVQFKDLAWNDQEFILTAFPARVVQHEIDHLKARLLVDYLSPLKRDMYVRKVFKKARRVRKMQKRANRYGHTVRASERRLERKLGRKLQPSIREGIDSEGSQGNGDGAGDALS